jgi:hypothetical protein
MLEMVKTATKNVNSVAGLFMDELACIFVQDEELDKDLVTWISEKMALDFENEFIVDVTKEELEGLILIFYPRFYAVYRRVLHFGLFLFLSNLALFLPSKHDHIRQVEPPSFLI